MHYPGSDKLLEQLRESLVVSSFSYYRCSDAASSIYSNLEVPAFWILDIIVLVYLEILQIRISDFFRIIPADRR